MFSFQERMNSFKNWPSEYRTFTKKLAIMGQYSMNDYELKTCCFYCGNENCKWNKSEIPLLAHLKMNSECPIYKIANKTGRREISLLTKSSEEGEKCRKLSDENEKLIESNFVQLNITKSDIFLCVKCGASSNIKHTCKGGRIQKIAENIDFESAQFYIKYLNGEFLTEISKLIKRTVTLEKEQKVIISSFLNEFTSNLPFQTLESFLSDCSDLVYSEIEKRMKKIEKDAFDSMYNDSIMY